MPQFLWTRPKIPPIGTLLLTHGAGAPMDTTYMTGFAEAATDAGLAVIRFEFAYMAERRTTGRKRPPPRADKLIGEFAKALDKVVGDTAAPLLAGGKSLGGRVAAMLGGEVDAIKAGLNGVVCLGYPFHPPKKPDSLRLPPLQDLRCPALICQGERDPFGTREEVAGYGLGDTVSIRWLTDGDHDLKPRKASGASHQGNIEEAAGHAADFARRLGG